MRKSKECRATKLDTINGALTILLCRLEKHHSAPHHDEEKNQTWQDKQ